MEQQEQANAVQLPITPEAISAVLAVRYAVDAEFRAAFDKDPKAALAEMSGQELPSDVEIVVHRNEDKHWNITLPAQETEGALGDEDIENVSGGTSATGVAGASILSCARACIGLDDAGFSNPVATAGGLGSIPGPGMAGLIGVGRLLGAVAVPKGTAGDNNG